MSDLELARQRFHDVLKAAQEGLAALPPPAVSSLHLKAGDSLKAALLQPFPITTEPGAIFEGTYSIPSDRTIAFGLGSGAHGLTGPALQVEPGTKRVSLLGGRFTSASPEAVLQLGENTTRQARLEDQPEDLTLVGVEIPTHRGKRGIALHAYRVRLDQVRVADVWSAQDYDSQALYIGNARGAIDVVNCELSAGSEVVLVGGDSVRTPGLNPTGLTFRRNRFTRPLAWMTDADSTKRRIKNLFELKAGQDVLVEDNLLDGNWNDPRVTQGCYAIVLTPALDGNISSPPKVSGIVTNVHIRGNVIVNTGAGINLIGRHYSAITDPRLDGVYIEANRFLISKREFGGYGQFCKIGGEPGRLAFLDNVILQDGSSHIYAYKGDVLDPLTGIKRKGGAIESLTYKRNIAELGAYDFNLDGIANAPAAVLAANVTAAGFSSNTYRGTGTTRLGAVYGGVNLAAAVFEQLEAVLAFRAELVA